eukprot:5834958-Ditylum_brightwellii.AAC.1
MPPVWNCSYSASKRLRGGILIARPSTGNCGSEKEGGCYLRHIYPMSFLACFLLVTLKENGKLEALPSIDALALMGKGKEGELETLPLFVIHCQSLSVHAASCCPFQRRSRMVERSTGQ